VSTSFAETSIIAVWGKTLIKQNCTNVHWSPLRDTGLLARTNIRSTTFLQKMLSFQLEWNSKQFCAAASCGKLKKNKEVVEPLPLLLTCYFGVYSNSWELSSCTKVQVHPSQTKAMKLLKKRLKTIVVFSTTQIKTSLSSHKKWA